MTNYAASFLILSGLALWHPQSFAEFSVPYPQRLVSAPGGTLWFTQWPNGAVGRITTDGAFGGSSGGGIEDLAVAPDGSLWATANMQVIHGQSSFSVPNVTFGSRIAVGPDGNIWFTETLKRIGRITAAGVVTEFSLPAGSGDPIAIAKGPDGNLWFTEFANRIGRISPTGEVAEFSLPGTDFGGEITAGSDGALWFTLRGKIGIGRITTAGTVSEFPILRFPPQGLPAIVLGPDGNIWFTEASYPVGRYPTSGPFPNRVGRITPDGTITEFDLPNSLAYPIGIAAGPDGNIWVAEFMGSKIARISPLLLSSACTRAVQFR